jgi:hypothetical protein
LETPLRERAEADGVSTSGEQLPAQLFEFALGVALGSPVLHFIHASLNEFPIRKPLSKQAIKRRFQPFADHVVGRALMLASPDFADMS